MKAKGFGHTGKSPASRVSHWAGLAAFLLLTLVWAGCGADATGQDDSFREGPAMVESLEGLLVEGEGPIPARLIYRSRNSLSNEEDDLVLEEIAQELDRLVELAGRLDEAITDETAKTDALPGGE
jgi:hypothetical protein